MEQVQQLSERRDDVAAAVSALAGIDAVLWQGGSEQLGPLFRQLDDLGRAVEAARVAVLAEAIERGETTTTMARAHTGWIVEWAPSLRAGGGQLLAVTRAATQQRHAQLREALLSGRVPVRAAAVCVEEMDRIRHRLTPEAVPSMWQALLSLAAEDGPRAVRKLRPALLARYGQAGELDRDQERAKILVALSHPVHGGDGLFDYTLRLDVEAKTVLEAALGPLSAPRPADGVPDLRPGAQRRGQALIELVRRARVLPRQPAHRGQGHPLGHHRLAGPARRARRRHHHRLLRRRDPPGPGRHPPPGLRRRDHPGRPGHRRAGPRPRPRITLVHPRPGQGAVAARPRLHHPRLLDAPPVVRRA